MYEGVDLLAEVFPDTADAPLPVLVRGTGFYGSPLALRPSPLDRRWWLTRWGEVRPAGTAEDGRLL